jgi:hypothetical protein
MMSLSYAKLKKQVSRERKQLLNSKEFPFVLIHLANDFYDQTYRLNIISNALANEFVRIRFNQAEMMWAVWQTADGYDFLCVKQPIREFVPDPDNIVAFYVKDRAAAEAEKEKYWRVMGPRNG